MFKSTSDNSQLRARRAITESRDNTGGIDPTSFKDPHQYRHALIIKKKELESKASKLRGQIKIARRRYTFGESGQVSFETVSRWEAERTNLANQVSDIDKRLTEIRADRHIEHKSESLEFAETFKLVAKEMLADPVYDRLIVATIHRMGEAIE